jgi:hypothetical protein
MIKFQKLYAQKIKNDFNFIVDSKNNKFRKILARIQGQKIFDNTGEILEAGYRSFVDKSPSDWILRLDSDEVINRAGIRFLDAQRFEVQEVVGFTRYQVVEVKDKFYILSNPEFSREKHIQIRLFNRTYGSFGNQHIHNPGFSADEREIVIAPNECAIYHLDFVIRDINVRMKKSIKYDALGQTPETRPYQILDDKDWKLSEIPDAEILEFLNEHKKLIMGLKPKR